MSDPGAGAAADADAEPFPCSLILRTAERRRVDGNGDGARDRDGDGESTPPAGLYLEEDAATNEWRGGRRARDSPDSHDVRAGGQRRKDAE